MKQFKSRPNKDFTLIGDEWSQEDNPNYCCSWCNRILSKLIDSSGQNPCYYCNHCQIQFEPSETQIRKKSKLGTQRKEVEPAVTSIQTDQSKCVEIRHEPELKGGFATLAKKGTIRFTRYEERVG
jgi:DNA-directed RNA polymerase subunit RPC12/RpoP